MGKYKKLYGELYYEHSPSLFKVIKEAILDRTRLPEPKYGEANFMAPIPPANLETFSFAIVVDGKVEDIIKVNSHLSRLFSQEHQMVEFHPELTKVFRGQKFDNGEFLQDEA